MPRDHLFAQVLQTGRRRNVDSWQRMEWIEHRRRHEGIKERHAKFDGNMLAMAANKATFSPMRTRAARSAGPRGIFPAPGGYVAGLHVRSLHCDDARLRAAGLRHSCSRRRGPMWYSIQPWQNARLRRGGWPAATGNRGAGGGSVVWGQTAGQRGVVVLGMLVGPANFVQAWTSNPPRGAPAAGRAALPPRPPMCLAAPSVFRIASRKPCFAAGLVCSRPNEQPRQHTGQHGWTRCRSSVSAFRHPQDIAWRPWSRATAAVPPLFTKTACWPEAGIAAPCGVPPITALAHHSQVTQAPEIGRTAGSIMRRGRID